MISEGAVLFSDTSLSPSITYTYVVVSYNSAGNFSKTSNPMDVSLDEGQVNFFTYRGDELSAEDIPLTELAREVGTPAYIYSKKTLVHHFRVFDDAFGGLAHLICFAMKANSNLVIL